MRKRRASTTALFDEANEGGASSGDGARTISEASTRPRRLPRPDRVPLKTLQMFVTRLVRSG